MKGVRPRFIPLPYQDSLESGRLILRDGSTATIRKTQLDDQKVLTNFFRTLSDRSKIQRFFSRSVPSATQVESFCDSSNPHVSFTLIVTRLSKPNSRIVAAGSYVARDETTAEIALAVDDVFQGKGIGPLLLERLALLAAANGFRRFWAVTMLENKPMLDVFRDSGFECRTRMDGGYVEIDLSVTASETSVARAELRDRVSTTASLLPFFKPRSVAVVGASRNPSAIGGRIFNGLIASGYKGPIYPVNPNAQTIAAWTAYPSVRAVPQELDLAVIAVPPDIVLAVIDDCAARATKAVIVITAGFAEIGDEGRELQRRLVEKIRGYGMRMIGPNCLGLLNSDPAVRLNASFAPEFPDFGPLAFCSQSGALGLAIISLAREKELGLGTFVSVGNKADVSGNDLLQYWEEDKNTRVILLYLESFGNPRRFGRIAHRVSRQKPIVAVKAGRTGAGKRAAGSHTAALAASDVAVDALFQQTGVIRADTLDEMFDLAAALSTQPLPPGRRVAILTNAGGLGILCADRCESAGLSVQELSVSTKNQLKKFLPSTASVTNPVDMIASASPDNYGKATEILLAAPEVDSLIVLNIHVGLGGTEAITRAVGVTVNAARGKAAKGKPVLASIMDGPTTHKPIRTDHEQLPNYAFPESAAQVLGKLARYAEWRNEPSGIIPDFDDIQPQVARSLCQRTLVERGDGWLSADDTRQVLAAFHLPLPPSGICRTAEESAKFATGIGFPVALKLASRTIVHKTEFGGVHLNLKDGRAVRKAFRAIHDRLAKQGKLSAMDGALVQPMLSEGVELMVGVTQDPSFGPLIAFGLGGIYVEILKDVCFRVTPISDRDAAEMVRGIRGYRLLEGYRGHPPADIPAIENLLLRVARLVEEVPEIAELDLNPVFAQKPGRGCLIADARIRVGPEVSAK